MPLSIPATDKVDVVVIQTSAVVDSSTVGNIDIPGLSYVLPRAGTYHFLFDVSCQFNATADIGLGVNFSGTVTLLQAEILLPNFVGSNTVQTTSGTLIAGTVSSTSQKCGRVAGRIDVTTSGTLKLQCSRSANQLTVAAGGVGKIQEL